MVSQPYLVVGREPIFKMTVGALGWFILENHVLLEKETISCYANLISLKVRWPTIGSPPAASMKIDSPTCFMLQLFAWVSRSVRNT
jgi:hypothetical protein